MAVTNPTYPAAAYQGPLGIGNWVNLPGVFQNDTSWAELGLNSGAVQLLDTHISSVLLMIGNQTRQALVAVLTSGTLTSLPTGTPTIYTYDVDLSARAGENVDGTSFGISLGITYLLSGAVNFSAAKELQVNSFNFVFQPATFVTHAHLEFQAKQFSNVGNNTGTYVDVNYFTLTLTYGNQPYAVGLSTGIGMGTIQF